jgi:hypothetical protein
MRNGGSVGVAVDAGIAVALAVALALALATGGVDISRARNAAQPLSSPSSTSEASSAERSARFMGNLVPGTHGLSAPS